MNRNYLSPKHESTSKGYIKKNTYISYSDSRLNSVIYDLLPEEYDVFSEIDQSLFSRNDTEQYQIISSCLTYMRTMLLILFQSRSIVCILPKLKMIQDSRGTITFNWAYSTFRASLSFDNEDGNYDAYYSIVFKIDDESMSTKIRKITLQNYKKSVEEILQLVVDNT